MAAIPVPYIGTGSQSQTVLGHYSVAQVSGAIAATPTALDVHASLRWAPSQSNLFLVLMRIKLGWAVISAVSTAVRMAYQASIARQFSVDFTTANTAINLATVAKTNAMRSSGSTGMVNSQMGANGPRISGTAALTGQTYTLDTGPFAVTVWEPLHSVSATGTAVQLNAGAAGPMQTLYEWTGLGQHPVVLGNNEGIAVQLVHTGWATGTVSLYTQWEWAEVLVF